MVYNLVKYFCSECKQGFNLEEDYDDACPYCGEFQLEVINPNANESQFTIEFPSAEPNPHKRNNSNE